MEPEESLLQRHPLIIRTSEDLLIHPGQARDRLGDSVAPKFLAIPVQAEIAHDGVEPCGKAGRAIDAKAPEPPEAVTAQLLTDKKKAVGDLVLFCLEAPDDSQNQG
jgi:hypothetical protein